MAMLDLIFALKSRGGLHNCSCGRWDGFLPWGCGSVARPSQVVGWKKASHMSLWTSQRDLQYRECKEQATDAQASEDTGGE